MSAPDVAPSPATVLVPGFVIDLARGELRTSDGVLVDLRPRSFAVLHLLAANAGRVVSKDQIMSAVWDDAVVTEDSLTQCVADIRRAIGDADRRTIGTIPRRGYLLAANPPPPAVVPSLVGSDEAGCEAENPPIIRSAAHRRWRLPVGGAVAGLLAMVLLVALWPAASGLQWELPPKAPDRPSLAVLPFKAIIPSSRNELLAIGLATEILNELARNKDLRVIARDSSFSFGARELSARDIGARLHVRYLVDGTA